MQPSESEPAPHISRKQKEQKLSGLLREEAVDAINAKNAERKKTDQEIQSKGILWHKGMSDFVPPNKISNIPNSWKEFYGYDYFTWRPQKQKFYSMSGTNVDL